MKRIICAFLMLSLSLSSFASCEALYQKRISDIQSRLNPPRTTVIVNAAGDAIVAGALAVSGVALTPAALISLPAVGLAAGAYLLEMELQIKAFRRAMHVIREAHAGKGPALTKFLKKFHRKTKHKFTDQVVIEEIIAMDTTNKFCEMNPETDKANVIKQAKMIKMVKKELSVTL
jgi:hypothetical protein